MGTDDVSNEDRVKAVETLRSAEEPGLKRYLRSRLHSREVDDAFQEIFVRLLVPPREPILDEVKYLYGTANFVCHEILRARKKSQERAAPEAAAEDGEGERPDAVSQLTDEKPGPAEIEEWRRTGQLLEAAVLRMDPLHRAVYVARDLDGLSVNDTAKYCGISVHKVERLLREARTFVINFITAREKDIL